MTARESRARRGMLTAEYLELARACEAEGRCDASWANLEAAHIVGQPYTLAHVRSHWAMMMFARRLGSQRELLAQLLRIIAAGLFTWLWVPAGNSGRGDTSAFAREALPRDLKARLQELPE